MDDCRLCGCVRARDHVYPEDDGVIVIRRPIGIPEPVMPALVAQITAIVRAHAAANELAEVTT